MVIIIKIFNECWEKCLMYSIIRKYYTQLLCLFVYLCSWGIIDKLVENVFVNRRIHISIQKICALSLMVLFEVLFYSISSTDSTFVLVHARRVFIHCKFHPVLTIFITYFGSYMLMLMQVVAKG